MTNQKPMKTLGKSLITSLGILLFLGGCSPSEQPVITLHLVGDSTMADKPEPRRNPERGWGQVLAGYFNDRVIVRNHAVNGRSTKSFLDEGKWNRVADEIVPGDYVFIQFGHNDQKSQDPSRYANPYSSYRRNLERMVEESREHGAHPVILSSIVRRKFNDQGTLEDTHGAYPFVARMVAESLDVPFIDLQQQTEDLVSGLGPERSAALYKILKPGVSEMYPDGVTDNTHLNESGALEIAGMVAESIRELGLPLARYLDSKALSPRVLVILGGHSYDTTDFFEMLHSIKGFRFDSVSHPFAQGILSSGYLPAYDLLLYYDYMPDLPPKDSILYLNLAHLGVPMLFLHHSICSFQSWEGFGQLVGGKYVIGDASSDPAGLSGYKYDLELRVEVVDRKHPVTWGMEDFNFLDEGYSNIRMAEGVTPLLRTDHPESSGLVGWTCQFDRTTSVYLMLGHDRNAYKNPSFRQLVENAARWLTE